MSTKKHDAGIHKYDKNGLCTNPSSLILHESDDYSYHLKFAETNVGWIGGYTLDCRQKVPKELLVNAKNTTYSSKQIACQTVAEIAWDFFRDELREGKSKKIKAAFKPLHDMLIELGSPLADEIKKTAPAKVKPLPGTEKPKDQAKADAPETSIIYATIVDDFCNYHYKINTGKQADFVHKVTNKTGIIDDDMKEAFAKLAVHLAVKDDIFKHSGIEIEHIDDMHTDELATLYQVTGFKMKGGPGNECVVLIGNKYLSGGDRMELESPKISIDNLSSYKWWDELQKAVAVCQKEVELYHGGKFTVKEKAEEEPTATQMSLMDNPGNDNHDSDFDETVD